MQRFQLYIVMALAPLFLSGCVVTYKADTSNANFSTRPHKETVYVTNQDHEAYDILKQSNIYNLTSDQNIKRA